MVPKLLVIHLKALLLIIIITNTATGNLIGGHSAIV